MGSRVDLNWSPLGWIGQEPVVHERVVREVVHRDTSETTSGKMSRTEKFMLAGVVLSGIGLVWQIIRS